MPIIQNQILNLLFINKGVEFIAIDVNKVIAFHNGRLLHFNELPKFAYKAIKGGLANPNATMEEMEVYVFQNHGGFDDKIDICENGILSEPEYVEGYSKNYNSNGISISEAQMRVLLQLPIEDKLIADTLCISKHTVARHCNGIYNQIGPNRTQAVQSAILKGII